MWNTPHWKSTMSNRKNKLQGVLPAYKITLEDNLRQVRVQLVIWGQGPLPQQARDTPREQTMYYFLIELHEDETPGKNSEKKPRALWNIKGRTKLSKWPHDSYNTTDTGRQSSNEHHLVSSNP